jgi:uncharacterized membrane protein
MGNAAETTDARPDASKADTDKTTPVRRPRVVSLTAHGARNCGAIHVCCQRVQGTASERTKEDSVSTVEKSIDVDVPVPVAYGQWTQFEEFPRFMEGVESIQQLDDTHLHWSASIDGVRREWDAEITEQHPDERVAWKATSGVTNAGVVTFHRIADDKTRVMLQLDLEPEGLVEKVGDLLGVVERQAAGDLERFKAFIENSTATGRWMGDIGRPSS